MGVTWEKREHEGKVEVDLFWPKFTSGLLQVWPKTFTLQRLSVTSLMWKQPATYMTNKSESQSVPGSQLFQPCLSCHHSRGHLCFLLLFSIHHLLLPINATCPSAGKVHGADCYQMLRSQSMSVLIHTARLAVSV